eukprot:359138-Chlamydomonas_euryale.AAC.1
MQNVVLAKGAREGRFSKDGALVKRAGGRQREEGRKLADRGLKAGSKRDKSRFKAGPNQFQSRFKAGIKLLGGRFCFKSGSATARRWQKRWLRPRRQPHLALLANALHIAALVDLDGILRHTVAGSGGCTVGLACAQPLRVSRHLAPQNQNMGIARVADRFCVHTPCWVLPSCGRGAVRGAGNVGMWECGNGMQVVQCETQGIQYETQRIRYETQGMQCETQGMQCETQVVPCETHVVLCEAQSVAVERVLTAARSTPLRLPLRRPLRVTALA